MNNRFRFGLMAAASVSLLAVSACSKSETSEHAMHEGMDHGSMQTGMIMADASISGTDAASFVDNFRLIDHEGKSQELYYHKDAPAIVIVTHGVGCPIVRGAMPDLRALRDEFASQGVVFYMLNSNLQDDREKIAADAAEFGIDIPVLDDVTQLVGESLGVDRTAQVFVIDPSKGFKTVYYGPLNDRQTYERQRAEASEEYVKEVLTSLTAGEPITTEAPAIRAGCMINFPERKREAEHVSISYANDIAPILQKNCVECHQDGSIGPWAMTDYQTISGWAPMIREVIRTDRMPP